MRTQPQTEIPLAAPVTPKISNEPINRSSSLRDEASFATTLDKSTKADDASRMTSAAKSEPEQDQSHTPDKSISKSPETVKPSDDQALTDSTNVTGESVLASNSLILPDTPLPEEIATDLFSDPTTIVPLIQHLIAEPNNKIPLLPNDTALPLLSDIDLTLALATTPIAGNNATSLDDLNAIPVKADLPTAIMPTIVSVDATASEQINTSAANAASNTAANIAPIIGVVTPQAKQSAKSTVETTILPTASNTTTSDIDTTAALPPIQENRHVDDKDLFQQALNKLINQEDQTAPIPLPTSMVSQATPATQSTDFHAIAKSLAGADNKSDTKSVPDNKLEANTAQQRNVSEVPVLSTAQPTTLAPNKINSEAVNAQPLLAQNGNAMEKAVTHQVQRALVQHLPTGERMMVLRMTPPELGTVRIEVIERNGVLSARLQAEDESVRVALERFLPGMRSELRSSDAPIREITLSDQAQFQRSFADSQQQQNSKQDHDTNRRPMNDGERFSLETTRPDAPLSPRIQVLGGQIGSTSINAFA